MSIRTPMSILDYDKPTDDEVAQVIDYWAQVAAYVRSGGTAARPSVQPSSELLAQVATHQQWQKAMLCKHTTVIIDMDGIRCGDDCGRECQYLSDVQIAELKK